MISFTNSEVSPMCLKGPLKQSSIKPLLAPTAEAAFPSLLECCAFSFLLWASAPKPADARIPCLSLSLFFLFLNFFFSPMAKHFMRGKKNPTATLLWKGSAIAPAGEEQLLDSCRGEGYLQPLTNWTVENQLHLLLV